MGGGTSTSFLKAVYDYMDYNKQSFGLSIWPSPEDKLASVIEPYNAVFNISQQISLREGRGMSVTLDNTKLRKLCTEQLKVEHPSYSDIN